VDSLTHNFIFSQEKVIIMPITLEDIQNHRDQFGLHDLDTMHTSDYRKALRDEAILWIDHHDFVRSTFSGEIIATNREQVDALIEQLHLFRKHMPLPPKWMSEK
jgi:hypothetical protein